MSMLISNLIRRLITNYSTTKPTQPLLCSDQMHVCLQGWLHGPQKHLGNHIEISLKKELWWKSFKQPVPAMSDWPEPCFHSRIHSDTRCHLKPNSENQYDKLRLVLSLNCFSLEIDTGARAIHHSLREVGAPRENGRASVRAGKRKIKEKEKMKWVFVSSGWKPG